MPRQACRRLGLEPDLVGFGWPDGRFRTRIEQEGLVLPGDEDHWSGPLSMEDRLGDILDAAQAAVGHFEAAQELFREIGLDSR